MSRLNIRIIKEVTFRDMHGTILVIYPVGHMLEATAVTSTYYVTAMGGIFFNEAEWIKD